MYLLRGMQRSTWTWTLTQFTHCQGDNKERSSRTRGGSIKYSEETVKRVAWIFGEVNARRVLVKRSLIEVSISIYCGDVQVPGVVGSC